jgi:hypothetical protein
MTARHGRGSRTTTLDEPSWHIGAKTRRSPRATAIRGTVVPGRSAGAGIGAFHPPGHPSSVGAGHDAEKQPRPGLLDDARVGAPVGDRYDGGPTEHAVADVEGDRAVIGQLGGVQLG